ALARTRGDVPAISRLETEMARHAAMVGVAPISSARRGRWWASVRSNPSRSAAITLTLLLVAAAIGVSRFSKPGAFVLLLGGAIALWVVAILPDFVVYLGLVIGWVFLGIA